MNIHKNARLTRQGRCLLVRRVDKLGWQMAAASNAAGISQRQGYRWLARYRSGSTAALDDAVRRGVVASIASARSGSVSSRRCGDSG
jgi:hypothetical protein